MRPDYRALYDQVRDALRLLEEVRADPKQFTAQLLRLGRLLFEPPLDAVTKDARSRFFRSEHDVKRVIGEVFVREHGRLLVTVEENLDVLSLPQRAAKNLDIARSHVTALTGALDVSRALETSHWENIKALPDLIQILINNKADAPAVAAETLVMAKEFVTAAEEALVRTGQWAEVAAVFDLTGPLDGFEQFYRDTVSVLAGTRAPKRPPTDRSTIDTFFWPARLLAGDVLRALSSRPQVHQSVTRLRVFLETFAREELLVQMEDAKATHKLKQNERALQRSVDGFLFGEGIFPLTHLSVADGSVDTFFTAKLEHGLSETVSVGSPPALIELKQEVRLQGEPAPSAGDVRKAVNDGLEQAKIYRTHLQAEWSSHVVYAVVAYNGPVRYFLEPPNDEVLLVYLGGSSPSGKKTALQL